MPDLLLGGLLAVLAIAIAIVIVVRRPAVQRRLQNWLADSKASTAQAQSLTDDKTQTAHVPAEAPTETKPRQEVATQVTEEPQDLVNQRATDDQELTNVVHGRIAQELTDVINGLMDRLRGTDGLATAQWLLESDSEILGTHATRDQHFLTQARELGLGQELCDKVAEAAETARDLVALDTDRERLTLLYRKYQNASGPLASIEALTKLREVVINRRPYVLEQLSKEWGFWATAEHVTEVLHNTVRQRLADLRSSVKDNRSALELFNFYLMWMHIEGVELPSNWAELRMKYVDTPATAMYPEKNEQKFTPSGVRAWANLVLSMRDLDEAKYLLALINSFPESHEELSETSAKLTELVQKVHRELYPEMYDRS